MSEMKNDLPIQLFVTIDMWRQWLADNYRSSGIWMRFYKKGKGESIHYDEALDEALCYGWIDSQVAKYDDDSYLQKFTPRRPRSVWSKRNIGHIERLMQEGRMMPPGLKEVEMAKADGRWERAYDSSSNMEIPADFLHELNRYPKAKVLFRSLNRTNVYAIVWRLQTAKTDATRRKRMESLIAMLNEEKKLH